jgi:predicted transposase/invertase (TIGR01784 family)
MLEIKLAREKVLAEGRAEGEAIGRAEGRAEERLENARSLKANGVPVEVIAKSLGLSSEEIEKL